MQAKGFGYVVNQEFAGIQVIFAMGHSRYLRLWRERNRGATDARW
jgi:hypothetical protein